MTASTSISNFVGFPAVEKLSAQKDRHLPYGAVCSAGAIKNWQESVATVTSKGAKGSLGSQATPRGKKLLRLTRRENSHFFRPTVAFSQKQKGG